MERLTRRMCGGWGLVEGCEINTPRGMRRIVERLAAYENTELSPEDVEKLKMPVLTIATQDESRLREIMQTERGDQLEILPDGEVKNEPLTLEKLREMDEGAVFIKPPDRDSGVWALVDLEFELCRTARGGLAAFENYGKTWIAYRRPPEGAHK